MKILVRPKAARLRMRFELMRALPASRGLSRVPREGVNDHQRSNLLLLLHVVVQPCNVVNPLLDIHNEAAPTSCGISVKNR